MSHCPKIKDHNVSRKGLRTHGLLYVTKKCLANHGVRVPRNVAKTQHRSGRGSRPLPNNDSDSQQAPSKASQRNLLYERILVSRT